MAKNDINTTALLALDLGKTCGSCVGVGRLQPVGHCEMLGGGFLKWDRLCNSRWGWLVAPHRYGRLLLTDVEGGQLDSHTTQCNFLLLPRASPI